jgi:hypothetical protein
MPDGGVTAGSNPARRDEERRIEVFWLPYLFAGPRPRVTPRGRPHYREVLTAEVPDAAQSTACLMGRVPRRTSTASNGWPRPCK